MDEEREIVEPKYITVVLNEDLPNYYEDGLYRVDSVTYDSEAWKKESDLVCL